MNLLLDTSFLCALHNENDAYFSEATELFYATASAHLIIPAIVMAEFLMGDVRGERMLTVCRELCGSFLQITEKELSILAGMPYALRKRLKATDCLILAFAQTHHAEIYTFDKKLRKAYEDMRRM